jgi:hypothetical protein
MSPHEVDQFGDLGLWIDRVNPGVEPGGGEVRDNESLTVRQRNDKVAASGQSVAMQAAGSIRHLFVEFSVAEIFVSQNHGAARRMLLRHHRKHRIDH